MKRITFIGAGSLAFTTMVVRDALTYPLLDDSTFVLMDIDKDRLGHIKRFVETLIQRAGSRAKVEATLDRREALKDSDAVLITILAGGCSVWRHDVEIPMKYGVNQCVGDTRSAGGVFRALRTIPVMLDIARDIAELCPEAIVLNYTNPMAMLCRAVQSQTAINFTGLCHSVQGTAKKLAGWIGAEKKDVDYLCAGINHQSWYLEYKWKGKDAYPLIRQAVEKPEIYEQEIVRNEMFKALGYYVTESSGHNSEYTWWFRKNQAAYEKYCLPQKGLIGGQHAFILNEYLEKEAHWNEKLEKWLGEITMERGREYAASIINAYVGGEMFQFNGNVPNTGLITNLPEHACVEIPVVTQRGAFLPVYVGSLPPQLAALNQVSIAVEEMAVQAALTGDPALVYHALCYDPLCAAVLDLQEIKRMVREMLKINRDYLPQFKTLDV